MEIHADVISDYFSRVNSTVNQMDLREEMHQQAVKGKLKKITTWSKWVVNGGL